MNMKRGKLISILLALVGSASVLSAVGARAERMRHPPATLRCSDALRIVGSAASEQSGSEDILLSSAPEFPMVANTSQRGAELVRLTPDNIWWRRNWTGEKPSPQLVRRWFATPYKSIAGCLSRKPGHRTVGGLFDHPISRHYSNKTRYSVQVSYPVTDAARKHALLVYSTSANDQMVGGKSEILLLELSRGKWRKVGSGFISVS
jgi:hypothetical protein